MTNAGAAPPQWCVPATLPRLSSGEIHVFAFPLDVPAARLTELQKLLSKDETNRVARFRQTRDLRRYMVGRAQLRTILGCYLQMDARAIEFHYSPHGRPSIRDGNGANRLRFNMSRSQELGVAALQLDEDPGIDLEYVRPFPNALDIARRFFAAPEHEALSSLPADPLEADFFSYWTRKEAVLKSVGLGLSLPMDAFALGLRPGEEGEQINVVGVQGTRWVILLPPPERGYMVALATRDRPSLLRTWVWAGPADSQ